MDKQLLEDFIDGLKGSVNNLTKKQISEIEIFAAEFFGVI